MSFMKLIENRIFYIEITSALTNSVIRGLSTVNSNNFLENPL